MLVFYVALAALLLVATHGIKTQYNLFLANTVMSHGTNVNFLKVLEQIRKRIILENPVIWHWKVLSIFPQNNVSSSSGSFVCSCCVTFYLITIGVCLSTAIFDSLCPTHLLKGKHVS